MINRGRPWWEMKNHQSQDVLESTKRVEARLLVIERELKSILGSVREIAAITAHKRDY